MKSLHLLIQRLADAGFEYVVVGGYASVLHGSAYVTDDLDVCAELSAENIGKLRTALADLNPRHRMTHGKISFLNQPPAGQAVHNLYLETEGGILDIITFLGWAIITACANMRWRSRCLAENAW
jgi:hypothetical protein